MFCVVKGRLYTAKGHLYHAKGHLLECKRAPIVLQVMIYYYKKSRDSLWSHGTFKYIMFMTEVSTTTVNTINLSQQT